jgi:hypothetical protein
MLRKTEHHFILVAVYGLIDPRYVRICKRSNSPIIETMLLIGASVYNFRSLLANYKKTKSCFCSETSYCF